MLSLLIFKNRDCLLTSISILKSVPVKFELSSALKINFGVRAQTCATGIYSNFSSAALDLSVNGR